MTQQNSLMQAEPIVAPLDELTVYVMRFRLEQSAAFMSKMIAEEIAWRAENTEHGEVDDLEGWQAELAEVEAMLAKPYAAFLVSLDKAEQNGWLDYRETNQDEEKQRVVQPEGAHS